MNHKRPSAPLTKLSKVLTAIVLAIGMASFGYQMGSPSKISASVHLRPESHGEAQVRQAVYSITSAVAEETTNVRSKPLGMRQDSAQSMPEVKMNPAISQASAGDSSSLAAQSSAPSHPPSTPQQAALALQQPHLPLVMLEVDLNALGLSNEQQALVVRLRKQFIAEVGGPNQNPADPNYLKRWQQAAPTMDEILRAQIGWNAFNAYTVANARAQAAQ